MRVFMTVRPHPYRRPAVENGIRLHAPGAGYAGPVRRRKSSSAKWRKTSGPGRRDDRSADQETRRCGWQLTATARCVGLNVAAIQGALYGRVRSTLGLDHSMHPGRSTKCLLEMLPGIKSTPTTFRCFILKTPDIIWSAGLACQDQDQRRAAECKSFRAASVVTVSFNLKRV